MSRSVVGVMQKTVGRLPVVPEVVITMRYFPPNQAVKTVPTPEGLCEVCWTKLEPLDVLASADHPSGRVMACPNRRIHDHLGYW